MNAGSHMEGFSRVRKLRFGPFELDARAGELRKHEMKIRLQEQPFQILVMLLERPDEIVLREEIRKRLWGEDTNVEFDHSINAAIKRLRDVLGDSAEAPHYVETVARRGYRFIAEVKMEEADPSMLPVAQRKPRNWRVFGAIVLLLVLTAAGTLLRHQPGVYPPAEYTQITNFTDSAAWPVLSPDGRMVAFFRGTRSTLIGDDIYVKLLPNGEPVRVTQDPRIKQSLAFSPDSSKIAYTVIENGRNTYTVSSLGGESKLFLSNASGLSWLDEHHVLFSELRDGLHTGIATAAEDRSEHRDIYFPADDRVWTYHSVASPDRKWALVVESDRRWKPCRLVAFDGSSASRQVGPPGLCSAAAWSPDGNWMYFVANLTGRRHLWRQRFPDGPPEQITLGATDEGGITMAPDGRSVITSISIQQSAIWIHDDNGDRTISTQGYASTRDESDSLPWFSTDGKRLYYLFRRDPESAVELWRTDIASGKSDALISGRGGRWAGFSLSEFDVSNDEKEAVFSIVPPGKPAEVWLTRLDRSEPPRMIASSGETAPHFGAEGQILFLQNEGQESYLSQMKPNGSGRSKIAPYPIRSVISISRDRRFVVANTAKSRGQGPQQHCNEGHSGWRRSCPADLCAVPSHMVSRRKVPLRGNCSSLCCASDRADGGDSIGSGRNAAAAA